MATTFASAQVSGNSNPQSLYGDIVVREGSYTFAAAAVINDVYQLVPVYAGETVRYVQVVVPDLDTSTGVVFSVGDGTVNGRYISLSTVGQLGGVAVMGAGLTTEALSSTLPFRYTVDDTIDLKITTAATGTALAAGTFKIVVFVS